MYDVGETTSHAPRQKNRFAQAMLQVAFAGTFPASLAQPVRRYLTTPCEIVVADETGILPQLSAIDVLVTMALTAEMGRPATRLRQTFRSRAPASIGSTVGPCRAERASPMHTATRPESPNM
jgi:putative effector of murein hydrolase